MTSTQRLASSVVALVALGMPACLQINAQRPAIFELPEIPPPPTEPAQPAREAAKTAATEPPDSPGTEEAELPLPKTARAADHGKPLPINLPTALALAHADPIDIALAGERVQAAMAVLDRAEVMWLPNVNLGVDYFRHDGQIQDIVGTVFTTSRSSLLIGGGPQAVVAISDAIYAPLAARHEVQARLAQTDAARNDTTRQVAESYFTVQQARGELSGAIEALRLAEELVRRAEKLAPELTPQVEVNRVRAEAARRRQAIEAAYERWQVASAELTRLLRLEPGTLVEPAEAPELQIELVDPKTPVSELITIALTSRPELAADQAVIQAALARVQAEEARPYIPSLVVRGVGSNTPGLGIGYFGGGINSHMSNFSSRFSYDIQAVWELQNLGFGNAALVREREAESRQAMLRLIGTQDRVSADVVQAHARVQRSARRLTAGADGVVNAAETAQKNIEAIGQTKRVAEQLLLVFRPQEVVAAVAALDQAYQDYYQALSDHNRAQFQLYWALGHPAECLAATHSPPKLLPATNVPAPPKPAPKRLPGLKTEEPQPLPTPSTELTEPVPSPRVKKN